MRRRDFLKAALMAPAGYLAIVFGRTANAQGAKSKKKPGSVVLCHKCGQIKGSKLCCKTGAKKCSKCGLHKGSPGCCRIKGAKKDVTLCTYCGQIKGSDKCCKKGSTKCKNCGLDKGSPGCCRIEKEEKPKN